MPDPWKECRRAIARHSRSFDLASRLFPGRRRSEVAALYAWCRHCDDAIDLAPVEAHAEAIEGLRETLRGIYAGEPQPDPVRACFQQVVTLRRIPRIYPEELLDGMAMDVENTRYQRLDDLLVYCWRVAGTVGLMMSHLMGVSDERAAPHAAHLGIAMQLTNICRDVQEDWRRSRVYLPARLLPAGVEEWLEAGRHRPEPPPLTREVAEGLAPVVAALLREAERYYASADAGLGYLEPRSRLAVRTARLVYAEIGRRVEAQECDVTRGRAVVPTRRKLRLAAHALRRFVSERRTWPGTELTAPGRTLGCDEALRLA